MPGAGAFLRYFREPSDMALCPTLATSLYRSERAAAERDMCLMRSMRLRTGSSGCMIEHDRITR